MRVLVIQNVDPNQKYAIAVTLRNLIIGFLKHRRNKIEINFICSKRLGGIDNKIIFFETKTNLYSLVDNFIFIFRSYNFLKKINKNEKIDIIQCRYPFSSLIGAILFKKMISLDVKIVYDIRSLWIETLAENSKIFSNKIIKKFCYWLESKLYKFIDGFIFLNEFIEDYYRSYIPNLNMKPKEYTYSEYEKIEIKKDFSLKERLKIGKKDFIIGVVTHLDKRREVDFLLYGFKSFLDKYKPKKNIILLIIGGGDEKRRLENLIKVLKLKNVILTDYVEHKYIYNFLSIFDIGVSHLPKKTIFEVSSPLKVIEYLSIGIPTLASNIKAHVFFKKYVGSYIHLYDNNYESFADELNYFVNHLPKRDVFFKYSVMLEKLFGFSTISGKYISLYQELLLGENKNGVK